MTNARLLQNPYEVTTEDKVQHETLPPAQISLTDCLACSGCVTSAEAVLVSLQSHTEVLNTLDSCQSLNLHELDHANPVSDAPEDVKSASPAAKIFVASISPQVRASLAATYGITERQAGNLIDQFLSGPHGLRRGGRHGNGFGYVVDTNRMREACLALSAEEVANSTRPAGSSSPRTPVLASACPGWICYAEKTHPHVLPHLSRLKSPQALTGTILKSVLSKAYNIHPSQIWHLSLMPCFDKKLEASRAELTDAAWQDLSDGQEPTRDVDCVITSRELLTLASARGISLPSLPLTPLGQADRVPFPDLLLSSFLFPRSKRRRQNPEAGTSGGYLHHVLTRNQAMHFGSKIQTQRGRNADVVEYTLISADGAQLMKCARFYGFRNIQNLVRKLKPARASRLPGAAIKKPASATKSATSSGADYAYVEVMACPGGCTNGGGQIKVEDIAGMNSSNDGEEIVPAKADPNMQKQWLNRVDEAYYSASGSDTEDVSEPEDIELQDAGTGQGLERSFTVSDMLERWSDITAVDIGRLVYTSYRVVESNVGKDKSGTERVAALAGTMGGGW